MFVCVGCGKKFQSKRPLEPHLNPIGHGKDWAFTGAPNEICCVKCFPAYVAMQELAGRDMNWVIPKDWDQETWFGVGAGSKTDT